MKPRIHIYLYIAATALLACTSACTTSAERTEMPQESVGIRFRNSVSAIQWSSDKDGRAVVQAAPQTLLDVVGVFGFCDNAKMPTVFANAPMMSPTGPTYLAIAAQMPWNYPDGTWPYEPTKNWIFNANYKFYVYSPYLPDDKVSVAGNEYSTFDTFTFNEVPDFSAEDYMVATELKNYANVGPNANSIQVVTLQHLQARLRFCYRLGVNYARVRRIVITDMAILSTGRTWSVSISHDANGQPLPMVWSVTPSSVDNPTTNVMLQNDPSVGHDGLELKTAELSVLASAYAFPQVNNGLVLPGVTITVWYDVYDLAGTRTRHQQTTTNYVPLGWTISPGKFYDVHITVEPDYLYVLSDHDPNTDGHIIIPDE